MRDRYYIPYECPDHIREIQESAIAELVDGMKIYADVPRERSREAIYRLIGWLCGGEGK